MRFIGIDPSKFTGVVVLAEDGKVESNGEIVLEKGIYSTPEEIQEYGRKIVSYASQSDLVCVEGFSFGSKGQAVSTLYGIGYAIRFALQDAGIKYYQVPPSLVKKFATGKGNTSKDNMIMPIWRNWNYENESDNVRDAFVLAQIARSINTGAISYKYQLEVLESILAPSEKVTKKKGGKGNGDKQRAVCNSKS